MLVFSLWSQTDLCGSKTTARFYFKSLSITCVPIFPHDGLYNIFVGESRRKVIRNIMQSCDDDTWGKSQSLPLPGLVTEIWNGFMINMWTMMLDTKDLFMNLTRYDPVMSITFLKPSLHYFLKYTEGIGSNFRIPNTW